MFKPVYTRQRRKVRRVRRRNRKANPRRAREGSLASDYLDVQKNWHKKGIF